MTPVTPERVRLAPGLEAPRVVVGLWQVADQERLRGVPLDREAGARAMAEHARAGLTAFDMADHYGSAEVVAGALVRRLGPAPSTQPRLQLLTKWVPAPGPVTRRMVADAVDRARERMGVDAIDLLQYHPWNYADPSWLDALFHLAEQRERGAIRHLGLTNCDAVHLEMAVRSGAPVATNQVCCSLLDRRALGSMSRVCQAHDVKLLAYGALAGGLLTRRWLGRAAPAAGQAPAAGLSPAGGPSPAAGSSPAARTWSQMKYLRFVQAAGGWDWLQGLLGALARVADRLGVSMANVACRWALDQPAVAAVIVGARLGERSHVADNLRLFGFSLDDEARAELDEAANRLDPIPGDCGDEYRKPPFLTASGDLSHHIDGPLPAPYPVVRRADGPEAEIAAAAGPAQEPPSPDARVSSGTPWERMAGYSRAVRRGDRIWVSGTTASHRDRRIGGDDAAAQTHFVIDKIEGALHSLGAGLQDVVRTRVYVPAEADWEAVARVHGARFGSIMPANTLVRAGLVGEGLLVEIEAEAVVAWGRRPHP